MYAWLPPYKLAVCSETYGDYNVNKIINLIWSLNIIQCLNENYTDFFNREAETIDPHSGPHVSQEDSIFARSKRLHRPGPEKM